jgi:hypothetical protein
MIEPSLTRRRGSLPEALAVDLRDLGEDLRAGRDPVARLRVVLEGLDVLPPSAVAQAEQTVRSSCQLYSYGVGYGRLMERELALLEGTPGLKYLFLFHGNGHFRAAALERIDSALASPFWVSAVAYRLNDWAGPVRAAAVRCVERVFPAARADAIAEAALFLFLRRRQWQRGRKEAAILDQAFTRSEVCRALARLLMTVTTGPAGRVLSLALERPGLDEHLFDLASGAVMPTIRAVALKTLLWHRATWFVRFDRAWVNKPYNISRLVPVTGERPVRHDIPLHRLASIGLRDKSLMVRLVLVDTLVAWRDRSADLQVYVRTLAADRNPTIRQRVAPLLRPDDRTTPSGP